jgi:hypothetical protein
MLKIEDGSFFHQQTPIRKADILGQDHPRIEGCTIDLTHGLKGSFCLDSSNKKEKA